MSCVLIFFFFFSKRRRPSECLSDWSSDVCSSDLVAEAVGQFNYSRGRVFDAKYRRTEDAALQQAQALRHAQAHDRGMAFPRCSGIVAWCGFDYGSLINSYRGVKYPGVADVFRIPKLGASFYQAQVSPKIRPVIIPNFYWDFGPETPHGPGRNC